MARYIFVTGGVCSSLGKGLSAASIGSLLEDHGLSVCMLKIDPYLNVDAGTMSPYQHGEVYVTDDGTETDLDLGNYFRFTNSPINGKNSITTGQVYQEVITRERAGQYLGRTVQVIPHITDQIKWRIQHLLEESGADLGIVEVGGTVGDIESLPFLEAIRQIIQEMDRSSTLSVHLVLVPEIGVNGFKTKPTQHSVRDLRETGIHPEILICRSSIRLSADILRKISLLTGVRDEAVISAPDVEHSLYEIPINFSKQSLDTIILNQLQVSQKKKKSDVSRWENLVSIFREKKKICRIAILGKYVEQADTYRSVEESLLHGSLANNAVVKLVKVAPDTLVAADAHDVFENIQGIIAPGGFGDRGVEGALKGITYARTHNIPYFGICLGMHMMVIEYAREVVALEQANSTEFDEDTPHPVISLLEEQIGVRGYGGTMRLGLEKIHIINKNNLHKIYKKEYIEERHRHRYEVSNQYRERLENMGLIISAETEKQRLVEAVEWKNHVWGLGVQFHPEFKSKPLDAHPVFTSFISAALANE